MTISHRLSRALTATWAYATGTFVWYALMAGVAWLVLYVVWRRAWQMRKINPRYPTLGRQGWEVAHSVKALLVFGTVAGVIAFLSASGIKTRSYGRIEKYGWVWYFASFAVAVVVHDTYFYWTHRLLHHRSLFRRVHRLHHLSHNPTPWAAYSFSVGEAYVQAGIGPLLLYAMPMHYSAFAAFMTWQITFNVAGHCGFEILPNWFLRTPLGRFLNTPTHHVLHHEKVGANYGLYFNFWDRLMGTNHAENEERFRQATASRPQPMLIPAVALCDPSPSHAGFDAQGT